MSQGWNVYESLSLANRADYTELTDTGFGSLTSAGKEAPGESRIFARNCENTTRSKFTS